jgi:hypothetical protein
MPGALCHSSSSSSNSCADLLPVRGFPLQITNVIVTRRRSGDNMRVGSYALWALHHALHACLHAWSACVRGCARVCVCELLGGFRVILGATHACVQSVSQSVCLAFWEHFGCCDVLGMHVCMLSSALWCCCGDGVDTL